MFPITQKDVYLFMYQLPDGRTIKVGSERFEAPECMFQPHLVDMDQPGVAGAHTHMAYYRSYDHAWNTQKNYFKQYKTQPSMSAKSYINTSYSLGGPVCTQVCPVDWRKR